MGFLGIVFLPQVNFSSTFLKNCVSGEAFRTTTCLRPVVGGKQGHVPCKIHSLQQSLFLCQLNFIEINRLS